MRKYEEVTGSEMGEIEQVYSLTKFNAETAKTAKRRDANGIISH